MIIPAYQTDRETDRRARRVMRPYAISGRVVSTVMTSYYDMLAGRDCRLAATAAYCADLIAALMDTAAHATQSTSIGVRHWRH